MTIRIATTHADKRTPGRDEYTAQCWMNGRQVTYFMIAEQELKREIANVEAPLIGHWMRDIAVDNAIERLRSTAHVGEA